MKRVLCAVDFSPGGKRVVTWAAALARRFGDALDLVHVVRPPMVIPAEVTLAALDLGAGLRASAERELGRLAEAVRTPELQVRTLVLEGDPEEALASAGKEAETRWLVVGTHGRTRVARLFLGSVAERIVRAAPCPVAVVRPDMDAVSLAPKDRPLRAVVGIDPTPASGAALAFVRQLRLETPVDLTFVRVYTPKQEHERLGITYLDDEWDADAEVTGVLERELRERVGQVPGPGKTALRLRPVIADEEPLLAEAELEQADFVVLATPPGRRANRAISALRQAQVPVLCVPAQVGAPRRDERPLAPLRKVLVPCDLSDRGNAGLAIAYQLLRASGGTVELCHAVDHRDGPLTSERKAELERRLDALVPGYAGLWGIHTRVSVIDGGAADETIARAAERLGVDLIVMATHGRGGLSRAVLGSVSDAVARRSSKPVLLVRPSVET